MLELQSRPTMYAPYSAADQNNGERAVSFRGTKPGVARAQIALHSSSTTKIGSNAGKSGKAMAMPIAATSIARPAAALPITTGTG
ncbi:MAG: hypothetical protein WAT61_04920 [Flavobacteriales bacterium]|nr:hypothetical protein [Flavobacteriales bacterium]